MGNEIGKKEHYDGWKGNGVRQCAPTGVEAGGILEVLGRRHERNEEEALQGLGHQGQARIPHLKSVQVN